MHEMSIAINIVEIAEKHVRAAGGTKVRSVELEIGSLAGVLEDALAFCFESAARNTLAEGAELTIQMVAGQAQCLGCRKKMAVDRYGKVCPHCHGLLEIISGEDCKLQAITIDE